ncbi:amidohydrolase (plasmid) [Alloyangia pacifica]|uniref:Amidohydrolase n=1 Tax=Alloyangia pacifica TaxID=311180 RepID=A0A2U8HJZ4_9RHOB|nr:amidohydrolase family protein [Alloyangia pacifica]AWI86112.1 amidohydrolase [Alloyangia pacifica]
MTTLNGVALAGRDGYWDVTLEGARIAALTPSEGQGGGLLLPCFADAHVHLDKTFTAARVPSRPQSLHEAIELMAGDKPNWTAGDLRQRAARGLRRAFANGTKAMRSHVDWTEAGVPAALPVLRELAEEWRGRVDLQLATLTPLDDMPEVGARIAQEIAGTGAVLGAFIYRNEDIPAKLRRVFDLAETHHLQLDFHVDEGLDPEAQGLDAILQETEARGMAGRVLVGHCCSLSVRPEGAVADLLGRAAEAGMALCTLPTTNAFLQDATPDRTPRLRGLAPIHEARAAGMPVMLASDNVCDPFYPQGDYDLFDVYRMAVLAGHLDPAGWLDSVTETPARWLGHDFALKAGAPADFIHIAATGLDDALNRPRAARTVWRGGAPIPETSGDLA